MNITKYPNFHFIAHEAEIHSTQKQTLHLVYKSFSLGEHIFFGKQRFRVSYDICAVWWHVCRVTIRVSYDDTCVVQWRMCCMMACVPYVWWHVFRVTTCVPYDDNYVLFWNLRRKKWTHESLFWSKACTLNNLTFFEFLHKKPQL